MSRAKKTEAQLAEMRGRILDAAYDILLEKGHQGLSARTIADRLGVSHMSLYTYFENQAAILRALRQREIAKWRVKQQVFDQRAETEDLVRVVEDLLRFFIAFARENPNLYRMAWVMPEVGVESPEENRQRMQATVGQLANILEKGMDTGVFIARHPFLAAGTVLAIVNTPYILFHSGKLIDPDLRDRMVEEVLVTAMGYLKVN